MRSQIKASLKGKAKLSLGLILIASLLVPIFNTKKVYAFDGSGAGTLGDPYVIDSCYLFKQIDMAPSAYYSLANDIDCAIEHNSMINALPFSGNFNGNNHSISIGLEEYPSALGLFSSIDGGTITDLNLTGTVDAGLGGTSGNTGALAGNIYNGATISNITSSVNVSGLASKMGGIAGEFNGAHATGVSNSGSVTSNTGMLGGLFGAVYCGSTVTDSSMSGDVSGNGNYAGGITGEDGCEGPGGTYTNVHSTGLVVSDGNYVGGIVGYGVVTTITQAYSTGYIEGIDQVGGIAGNLLYSSLISKAYSTGEINGYGERVGGIVGNLGDSSSVSQSYSTSNVTTHGNYAGGLVGFLDGGSVSNSYARGAVHGNVVGGLVGRAFSGTIDRAYSTGMVDTENEDHGGLVGITDISGDNGLFWDTETSIGTSVFGHGKTTSEMKNVATYTDTSTVGLGLSFWDFIGTENGDTETEDLWAIQSSFNDGYPCLTWDLDCTGDVQENAGTVLINPFGDENQAISVEEQEGSEICTAFSEDTYARRESDLAKQDAAYDYNSPFIGFSLTGCDVGGTTTMRVVFTGSYDLSKVVLRKYNAQTQQYSSIEPLTKVQTTLNSLPALEVTYQITDGGVLDEDGLANGVIVDPVALGSLASAEQSGTLASTGSNNLSLIAGGLSLVLVSSIIAAVLKHKSVRII